MDTAILAVPPINRTAERYFATTRRTCTTATPSE